MKYSLLVTPEQQLSVEHFLYVEAELLDDKNFTQWADLLADDVEYFMPIRQNRLARDTAQEIRPQSEGAHIREGKAGLVRRAKKLGLEYSWSETPVSRERHLITNVLVRPTSVASEYSVKSNFHFYKSRGDALVDQLVGCRDDILRVVDTECGFMIVKRTVLLDQALIQVNSISTFL